MIEFKYTPDEPRGDLAQVQVLIKEDASIRSILDVLLGFLAASGYTLDKSTQKFDIVNTAVKSKMDDPDYVGDEYKLVNGVGNGEILFGPGGLVPTYYTSTGKYVLRNIDGKPTWILE